MMKRQNQVNVPLAGVVSRVDTVDEFLEFQNVMQGAKVTILSSEMFEF